MIFKEPFMRDLDSRVDYCDRVVITPTRGIVLGSGEQRVLNGAAVYPHVRSASGRARGGRCNNRDKISRARIGAADSIPKGGSTVTTILRFLVLVVRRRILSGRRWADIPVPLRQPYKHNPGLSGAYTGGSRE